MELSFVVSSKGCRLDSNNASQAINGMTIDLNLAVVLEEVCLRNRLGGSILVLAEQSITFNAADLERALRRRIDISEEGRLSPDGFFSALGFEKTTSIKVGASHEAFDLNAEKTPANLVGQFDVILNNNVLEHVFHLPHALAHLTRMLRFGGVVVHVAPCNNWVDSGFYQFSPTFWFDYYRGAKFQSLESILIARQISDQNHWFIHPLIEGETRHLQGRFDSCMCHQIFVAKAGDKSQPAPIPLQRAWDEEAGRRQVTRWFAPYRLESGVTIRPRVLVEVDIRSVMEPVGGHAWRAQVPELVDDSDTIEHPRRSVLVVLEDGLPLGPPHTQHDEIQLQGMGRYSHWGEEIVFSASDNRSPHETRRSYVAILSHPIEQAAGP